MDAAPVMSHAEEAMQWLQAHHNASPIARHALFVLESIGAVDVSFETFVVSLLPGGHARVALAEPQFGIAPGQACVLYQGSRVLGGGWIERERTAQAA